MRVVIVGAPSARARLRAMLVEDPGPGFEIVGEARTIAGARERGIPVDGWLVAAEDPAEPHGVEVEPLTARELEIVELMAGGLSNKSIARRLGISDQTVKFHVASICGKLGAANRTDASRQALRRGLIPL